MQEVYSVYDENYKLLYFSTSRRRWKSEFTRLCANELLNIVYSLFDVIWELFLKVYSVREVRRFNFLSERTNNDSM